MIDTSGFRLAQEVTVGGRQIQTADVGADPKKLNSVDLCNVGLLRE